MKKLIIIILGINGFLLLILGALFYLSEVHPIQPGQFLFDVQSMAENERIRLTGDAARRAEMSLDLVERRLTDLMLADIRNIDPAIFAFDNALSAAIRGLDGVPPIKLESMFQQIKNLLVRVDVVLVSLKERVSDQELTNLQAKVKALQAATTAIDLQKASADNSKLPSSVKPKTVPFLGKDVDHGKFPMYGGHQDVDCLKCHVNGEYAKTATACSFCHKAGNKVATDQNLFKLLVQTTHLDYGKLECNECHTVYNWKSVEYAHANVNLCLSCHANDAPERTVANAPKGFLNINWDEIGRTQSRATHYPGDCSICHTDTEDWKNWEFTHNIETCTNCHSSVEAYEKAKLANQNCLRMRTCDSCHKDYKHTENYSGDCTNCHNDTENWKNLEVDHKTYTACLTCHKKDKPAVHYKTTCSNCHSTETWKNATFNHVVGSDCKSCHEVPVDHKYEGQCGICHTLTGWRETEVAHKQTTCETCHQKINGHMNTTQACATCHSSESWNSTTLMHNGTYACATCHTAPGGHLPGACEGCHTTKGWTDSSVFHKLASCNNCHSAPYQHYPSACVSCHVTTSWMSVNYPHNEPILCSTCHKAPLNHYPAECVLCHNTFTWGSISVIHTTFTNCFDCHTTPIGHYPGSCSLCHGTSSWLPATYTHKVNDNCTLCHAKPAGHWPGQCSDCHNTSNWADVTFDHTNYTDCKLCHVRPANHDRGQCSKCHTTVNWIPIPTPTPLATEGPTYTPTNTRVPTHTPTPTPSKTPIPSPTQPPAPPILTLVP